MAPEQRRRRTLSGYCTSCGGDCFDGVQHRCPQRHPLASEMVALKFECDRALGIMARRPWARTITADDYEAVRSAIEAMLAAMGREAP